MLCILMVFNAVFSDGIHSVFYPYTVIIPTVFSDGIQCCVFWWYSVLCFTPTSLTVVMAYLSDYYCVF